VLRLVSESARPNTRINLTRPSSTLIAIDGEKVLAIEPPEEGSSFPTMTGYFTDASGRELLRIERNIWSGPATAWDVEVRGPTITVRPTRGVVGLRLHVEPPNEISIEQLGMRVGDSHLQLRSDWLDIGRVQEGLEYNVGIEKMECFVPEVAVQVDAKGFPNPEFRELEAHVCLIGLVHCQCRLTAHRSMASRCVSDEEGSVTLKHGMHERSGPAPPTG
jgi:hypothetical protein